MPKQTSIAKITRPTLADIYPRRRLFRLLDAGRNRHVTCVSGPAGSGKTTLVASWIESRKLPCLWYQMDEGDADLATFFYYLGLAAKKAAPRYKRPLPLFTPEYSLGIPTFTRRFSENLCSCLHQHHVIVFDNYHEIPSGSMLHEIMPIALSALPENITAVIISRSEPPAAFSGLQAANRLQVIGWDDIKLTVEESKGLVRLQEAGRRQPDFVEWLHEKTHGWAAGLVLLSRSVKSEGIEEAFKDIAPEKVFDYFASELFDRLDLLRQDFLLKTAFVPKITPRLAEELTGNKAAGRILLDLNRKNYFTEKRSQPDVIYQYHDLFRDFLMTRAATRFKSEELSGVRLKAAKLLEESGHIEDAAALFIQSEDWKDLSSLVVTNAPNLVIQGRGHTVGEWLESMPGAAMESNPWLIFWYGICKMTVDLLESRKRLEQAYSMFKDMKDVPGIYLSWCGIIDTFVFEWADFIPLDHWISEIEALIQQYRAFPSPEIEARVTYGIFCALIYRQPQHPDLPKWTERATAIALGTGDVRLRTFISSNLILYFSWWKGDMSKASLLIDNLHERVRSKEISPLFQIVWIATAAVNACIAGENERCHSLIQNGLELAEATGVHLWDFMLFTTGGIVALNRADLASAEEYLRRMSYVINTGRRGDIINYYWLRGYKLLVEENYQLALEHEQLGLKIAREGGSPMAIGSMLDAVAEALIEVGNYRAARKYLDEAGNIAAAIQSKTLKFQGCWLDAFYYLRQGKRSKALEALCAFLSVSKENRIFNHVQWRAKVMAELYTMALEEDIEVEHVRKLIRTHQMVPSESQTHLDNWPWLLKISTFGEFMIYLNDKPVQFSGKVQKKPLELLKALIALGGRDVSEERIVDALWPETSGDLANKSFEMALQRLRKLLSNDKAIHRQDGMVSLDDRYCWTDVGAFEEAVRNAEFGMRNEKQGQRPGERTLKAAGTEQLEKALNLYKGHFLSGDTRQPWVTLRRERLRSKYLRLVTSVGELYEQGGEWKKAAESFERGLGIDPICEEFYQHLMICHDKLGHRSEAVRTYQRCRSALLDGLGLEPSSKTEGIHASLFEEPVTASCAAEYPCGESA